MPSRKKVCASCFPPPGGDSFSPSSVSELQTTVADARPPAAVKRQPQAHYVFRRGCDLLAWLTMTTPRSSNSAASPHRKLRLDAVFGGRYRNQITLRRTAADRAAKNEFSHVAAPFCICPGRCKFPNQALEINPLFVTKWLLMRLGMRKAMAR
jgi:hypothetical protein